MPPHPPSPAPNPLAPPSSELLDTQGFDVRLTQLVRCALDLAGRTGSIAHDIQTLSRLFGAERAERKKDYLQTPAHRAAYLAFFTPRSAAQTALLIARAMDEGHVRFAAPPRVLDLGSGPMSGILGTWLAAGALGASHAVDISAKALAEGSALVGALAPTVQVTSENISLTAAFSAPGQYDLVILSHVLNEIGDPRRGKDARFAVLRRALAMLAPGGRILVVEPATRVHGRALMRLRDEIVEENVAAILAPCPAHVRTCPLHVRASDWCHADLPWTPPEAFAALTKAAGLPAGDLKVSPLWLAKEGRAPDGARLVGGIMRGDGLPDGRYACTPRGLVTLQSRAGVLPDRVGARARGEWLEGPPPAGVNVLAAEAGRAQKSSSRRPSRGRGGGGGRSRS